MHIRVADNKTPGVRTFYVESRTVPGKEHTCQYVRRGKMRRWYCTCGDFTYRRLPKMRHCDHLKELVILAKGLGGVTKLVKALRLHALTVAA